MRNLQTFLVVTAFASALLVGFPRMAKAQGGSITVKGSDTMVILGQRWAEVYMSRNPGVTIQVTGGGSGTGIAALINGTTDIAGKLARVSAAARLRYTESSRSQCPRRYSRTMRTGGWSSPG
jgi:phosphate transport system substrate-binding protein